MSVKLIWSTPHGEELVAYMARVSNQDNQDNKDTAPKLLKYLMKHKHWSPFEMVNICMEIYTTRDIARQILRHRSFSFQEFSQRYAEVVDWDRGEARLQDNKNRQNSIPTQDRELQSSFLFPFIFFLISFYFMTRFTQHLQLRQLTKHSINIYIPTNKPHSRINHWMYMIYLYICCYKLFLTHSTLVMLCHQSCLLISLPTNQCSFKGCIFWRPLT